LIPQGIHLSKRARLYGEAEPALSLLLQETLRPHGE
jgi:hypothetical protein